MLVVVVLFFLFGKRKIRVEEAVNCTHGYKSLTELIQPVQLHASVKADHEDQTNAYD